MLALNPKMYMGAGSEIRVRMFYRCQDMLSCFVAIFLILFGVAHNLAGPCSFYCKATGCEVVHTGYGA